jgi:hypothetical protein
MSYTPVPQSCLRGRALANILQTLLEYSDAANHQRTPITIDASVALAAAPFADVADLARFCSNVLKSLELDATTLPMLICGIESCFEFISSHTIRMLVVACACFVCKMIDDEPVYIVDVATLLNTDIAQLRAAEAFFFAAVFQSSDPSGIRTAPTTYSRLLISSYPSYEGGCAAVMDKLAATHIACSWRRTLAVRASAAKATERDAAVLAKAKQMALVPASKLDAAVVVQRAYRKAVLAHSASPVSIMYRPLDGNLSLFPDFVL